MLRLWLPLLGALQASASGLNLFQRDDPTTLVCVPAPGGTAVQPQVIVYPVTVSQSCPADTTIFVPGCSTGITVTNAPTIIQTQVTATTTVTATITSVSTTTTTAGGAVEPTGVITAIPVFSCPATPATVTVAPAAARRTAVPRRNSVYGRQTGNVITDINNLIAETNQITNNVNLAGNTTANDASISDQLRRLAADFTAFEADVRAAPPATGDAATTAFNAANTLADALITLLVALDRNVCGPAKEAGAAAAVRRFAAMMKRESAATADVVAGLRALETATNDFYTALATVFPEYSSQLNSVRNLLIQAFDALIAIFLSPLPTVTVTSGAPTTTPFNSTTSTGLNSSMPITTGTGGTGTGLPTMISNSSIPVVIPPTTISSGLTTSEPATISGLPTSLNVTLPPTTISTPLTTSLPLPTDTSSLPLTSIPSTGLPVPTNATSLPGTGLTSGLTTAPTVVPTSATSLLDSLTSELGSITSLLPLPSNTLVSSLTSELGGLTSTLGQLTTVLPSSVINSLTSEIGSITSALPTLPVGTSDINTSILATVTTSLPVVISNPLATVTTSVPVSITEAITSDITSSVAVTVSAPLTTITTSAPVTIPIIGGL